MSDNQKRIEIFMPSQTAISAFAQNEKLPNSELRIYTSNYNEQIGELILMVEICDAKENTKKIIKHIIEDTEYHYFNSIAKHAEKALEDALQKVNLAISETIKHTKKDWLARSSVLIAAHFDNEVHFAQIGKINAFLVSGKESVSIVNPNEKDTVNPVKPFGNIYSGAMPQGSALLFVTSSVLDYISQEKLRKICAEQSLKTGSIEIKALLKKAPENKHFGAVIVKRQDDQKDAEKKPSRLPVEEETRSDDDAQLRELEQPKKQTSGELLQAVTRATKQPGIISNRINRKALANKIIILALGILVVWFGINLLADWSKQKTQQKEPDKASAEYQTLLGNIQSQFIEAQNYLIGDKRDEALLALQKTQTLINSIPDLTQEQQDAKRTFSRKIATQLLLAQGVNLLVPELIAETRGISTRQILLKDSTLYTINTEDNSIFALPLSNKTLAKLSIAAEAVGNIEKIIDHTAGSIIFYHSLDSLAELDVARNTLKPIEWQRTWAGAPRKGDIYQNKLYVITPSNTILKYARSITGYTQETSWLKEPQNTALADAIDMAVDGAVWTIAKNGALIKFFKGARENFTATIAPPLKEPTRIFTDLDLKYLYIMDPGTNRVVVIVKETGAVATQFTAQEFVNLKDFAVNEPARKIYLLDQNGIFEAKF